MRLTTTFILISLSASLTVAQSISGKVTDFATAEPIPYANVYFAGTLQGAVTSTDGTYKLQSFRPGRYDLVVSHIGYLDSIQTIEVKPGEDLVIDIALRLEPKLLSEVFVNADTTGWRDNYLQFRRYFLGTTANSSEVEITNPEVLHFYYDAKERKLYAHAKEDLEIFNNALGYRIYYNLKRFDISFRSGALFSFGIPRFEAMKPKSKKQERNWQKARKVAYRGSFEHFLNALQLDSLEQQGFVVNEFFRVKNKSRPPQSVINAKRSYFRNEIRSRSAEGSDLLRQRSAATDSLVYWTRLNREPVFVDSLGGKVNSGKMLLSSSDTLSYEGMLQIIYLNEREEFNYAMQHRRGGQRDNKQTSLVSILDSPVVLYENGYYNVSAFFFEQYLGWHSKMSEMLPLGYKLEE